MSWHSSATVEVGDDGGVLVGFGSPGQTVSVQRPQQSSNNSSSPTARNEPTEVTRLRSQLTPYAGGGGSGSGGEAGALSTSRIGRGALRQWVASKVSGPSPSETYWVPDARMAEKGLLEYLHRRGPLNKSHVLLSTRPLEELRRNFSTGFGDHNVNLSDQRFTMPKATLVFRQMNSALDSQGTPTTMTVNKDELKQAVAQNLQSINDEEYYLVRYRDYSRWAIEEYPNEVVRVKNALQTYLEGRRPEDYVEQCFAVHVGREPGALIPITEAQLLFGVELISRNVMNQFTTSLPSTVSSSPADPEYARHFFRPLNSDQFNSLWAMTGEGFVEIGVNGEEAKKRERKVDAERAKYFCEFAEKGGDVFYRAPAWWDWSPAAIRVRIQHRLKGVYTTVGQFIVQGCVLAVTFIIIYRSVRGPGQPTYPTGYNRSYSGYRGYDNSGPSSSGFVKSVLLGPKLVFDYLVSPSSDY